jgi:FKBP-type peptidyl-prolyl cis-trans isomerase
LGESFVDGGTIMNRRSLVILAVCLAALTACTKGCSTENEAMTSACKPSSESIPELKIVDIKSGEGAEAVAGKSVTVHYTGTFMDCKKFDSSLDRGEPFHFQLGSGMVIPGWDQGVVGMKVGGKRLLLVPYAMAYGEAGNPGGIPPNSDLRFEVELLEVQ